MTDRSVFVRNIILRGLVPTVVADRVLIETFDEIAPALRELSGNDVVAFFARPLVTYGNGETETSVSWYVSRSGTVRPWRTLDNAEKTEAGAKVALLLDRLEPALADPEIGPIIRGWLHVTSLEDDLVLIGGDPHLLNWGLLPADVASDSAARAHHLKQLFLMFAPKSSGFEPAPPVAAPQVAPSTPAPAALSPTVALADESAPRSIAGETSSSTRYPAPLALAVATGLLVLILLVLLIPGVLSRHAGGVNLTAWDTDALQAEANESLRRRIAQLNDELSANVCLAEAGRSLDIADLTPRAREPLPRNDGPLPPTGLPSPVSALAIDSGGRQPLNLLEFLDAGTALVFAAHENGSVSLGTAFFVNDRQLVTNRHVVASGDSSRIKVLSAAFGAVTDARIVAQSTTTSFGEADFAVLEVEAPVGRQVFTLAPAVERMQDVIAVGYPGLVMETDAAFQRLQEGDTTAFPQAVVTQGNVVALQTSAGAMPLIVHTATIAQGNSGGPLVDSCGRVVGVNTFLRFDQETALRLNFALRAGGLRDFLDLHGIAYESAQEVCAPPLRAQVPSSDPVPATALEAPAQTTDR